MKTNEIREFAIREEYPNVVSIRGDYAFDKDDKKIEIDEVKIDEKIKQKLQDLPKEEKINEINNCCENSIVNGFYSSVLGEKHFYYSTIAEQSTLNSLVALGVDNGFKAQKIVVVDDVETLEKRIVHNHTHEQLKGVLADGAIHIGTQVAKKDELEIAIENATTVDEVNAIQW